MVLSKTGEEIELLRLSNRLVGRTLGEVASWIKPGVTTGKLNAVADEFIRDHGGIPAFLGYNGFPGSLCISVNEQVVHGIPGPYEMRDGDLISVDCGVLMNGFFGDSAYTFFLPPLDDQRKKLLDVTLACLLFGIRYAIAGNRIGDIGFHIQRHAEESGFSVVRELVGHGVGRSLHEKPEVPNYGRRGNGITLTEGMTIAIEPMINMGGKEVFCSEDGWTIFAADKKPAAHFEHSVVVKKGNSEILSTFEYIEAVLKGN
jgi:methionyl aminopeptidase